MGVTAVIESVQMAVIFVLMRRGRGGRQVVIQGTGILHFARLEYLLRHFPVGPSVPEPCRSGFGSRSDRCTQYGGGEASP